MHWIRYFLGQKIRIYNPLLLLRMLSFYYDKKLGKTLNPQVVGCIESLKKLRLSRLHVVRRKDPAFSRSVIRNNMAVILDSVFFRLTTNTFVESLNFRQNVFERKFLNSVADPGSGAFLTPGSGIRNRFFSDLGSRIPNPYF